MSFQVLVYIIANKDTQYRQIENGGCSLGLDYGYRIRIGINLLF